MWKEFKDNFLSAPHSYLLTINVDWFQPFTHVTYSTGAIYLTVQNLPRTERYKQVRHPGPKESSLNINSYLSPLVEELNLFWRGVLIPIEQQGVTLNINVRLVCVACDIPASKVSGFVGHNARLGCNKCLKEFERFNFSGYDRENWQPRVTSRAVQITKVSVQKAESVFDMPYLKFTVVDPMHNLYLGTGKHVFKVWIEMGILTSSGLSEIESRLKCFRRLPSNISSCYNGFTANQWCSLYIPIYSAVVLKGIVPDSCWLLVVVC